MLRLVKLEFTNIVSDQHYCIAISYLSMIMMLLLSHSVIMMCNMCMYMSGYFYSSNIKFPNCAFMIWEFHVTGSIGPENFAEGNVTLSHVYL